MICPLTHSHALSCHTKGLAFENTPTLPITGGTEDGALRAGMYDFTLQVTDYKQLESGSLKFGSRYASTSVSLTLVDLPIPDVGVSVNRAITAISEAGQINADTKIVLTGFVARYDASATRIEGRWEVLLSGGFDALDLANEDIAPLGNAKPHHQARVLWHVCVGSVGRVFAGADSVEWKKRGEGSIWKVLFLWGRGEEGGHAAPPAPSPFSLAA
jgi:hypothetical protein